MEEKKLVMVPIDKLNPHPANPRKNLGDLDELENSIRKNGILQNLTVVPYWSPVHKREIQGLYTVIIGHRRLEAARRAGVKELPCAIVKMTPEQQLATMLVENMQRSDLTYWEEGKGFEQLAMDFGKSTEQIARLSGFSETTVRRRMKIAKLPERAARQACERGATLDDFLKVQELENEKDRENAMNQIGTSNFANCVRSLKQAQEAQKRFNRMVLEAAKFANKIEEKDVVDGKIVPMEQVAAYYRWEYKTVIRPDDAGTVPYYYRVMKENCLYIYVQSGARERKQDPEIEQRRKQMELQAQKEDRLDRMRERHYELRREFIRNCNVTKENLPAVLRLAADAIWYSGESGVNVDYTVLADVAGLEKNETETAENVRAAVMRKVPAERALLLMAWCALDHRWKGYSRNIYSSAKQRKMSLYIDCPTLDQVTYCLQELGYQESDEERQMRRGSHPDLEELE